MGGVNLYAYAQNDPINLIDPYDLFGWADMPLLPQWFVNRSAGLGDSLLPAVSFGLVNGQAIRNRLGIGGTVNRCSSEYRSGQRIGMLAALITAPEEEAAAEAAEAVEGAAGSAEAAGLNLFKWGDETSTKAAGWKEGDNMLHLPDQGTPKLNWKQNAGYLREEMGKGKPI